LRTAFEQFLGAESPSLMAMTDLGEFKFLAIERFRGILHREVKASIGNNSPLPPWVECSCAAHPYPVPNDPFKRT
jgi:hypothetical protein